MQDYKSLRVAVIHGKNSHFCFLLYLLWKWSDLSKNFTKCRRVNSDFSYVKVTELVNKYSLVSMRVLTSCISVLQRWDLLSKMDIYACQQQRRWRSCTYPRRKTTDSKWQIERRVSISLTLDNRIIKYNLRLKCKLKINTTGRRPLRSADNRTWLVKRSHDQFGDRRFATSGPTLRNSLPEQLRQPDITFGQVKRSLKTLKTLIICLLSWATAPCVWTLRALTRNLLTYLLFLKEFPKTG